MKINTPLKFAILICLIISFFVILYSYLSTLFNPIIVGAALFIIYFSATYYLLKYQFYEKVKIIYKNIYKFKGTSNISDLNLEVNENKQVNCYKCDYLFIGCGSPSTLKLIQKSQRKYDDKYTSSR